MPTVDDNSNVTHVYPDTGVDDNSDVVGHADSVTEVDDNSDVVTNADGDTEVDDELKRCPQFFNQDELNDLV